MDGHEPFQAQDALEALERRRRPLVGGEIVACGEEMGGIHAHAKPLGVRRVFKNAGELLEGVAEGGALPGGRLQRHAGFHLGELFQNGVEPGDDFRQSRRFARAHVRAGMQDQEGEAELVGADQFVFKGEARLLGKFGIHRREVDHVAAVGEDGAEFSPARMFMEGFQLGWRERRGGEPLHVVFDEDLHRRGVHGEGAVDGQGDAACGGHVRADE